MGSTGIYTNDSFEDVLKYDALRDNEIVKFAKVKQAGHDAVFYCAVKIKDGKVIGAVVLMSRHGREVIYKIIDEFSGPCYYKCPQDILRLLTPLDEFTGEDPTYARNWRNKCNGNNPPTLF